MFSGPFLILKFLKVEIKSPRNVLSYIHEVSIVWLPKHDPPKDDISKHVDVERGKVIRP